MKRITMILLVFTMILTIALSGCSGDREELESTTENELLEQTLVEGGTLRVGISQDLDSLDPHLATSAGTREVLFNIYEGLVKPDPSGAFFPAVAEDFTISEDATVFTFTLREGIRFHDGEPVTMDDVRYSIERNADTTDGAPLVSAFSIIESIHVLGEDTLEIVLQESDIEFIANMTVAIVPKHAEDLNTNPIGTGPFMFESRRPQENFIMGRFDDYWGENAHLDRVEMRIIADSDMIVTNLLGGSIDMFMRPTAVQINELNEDFNIEVGTMNLVQALYLNNAVAPLDNEKVRQALSYAIDPEQIITMLGGHGVRVGSSMYPGLQALFDEELTTVYRQDVTRAKVLLAEAGLPDGFDLEITVSAADQPHMDTAQIIVEQLRNINVNATIRPVEWSVWLEEVHANRDYMSTVVGVDARVLTGRAMLERFTSTASGNFTNFNDSAYDALFLEAIGSTDREEQIVLYKQLQRILTERAANVYIQDLANFVAIRNNFSGYVFYPLFVQDFSTIYMVE
ncbi:MAG: ABC transporter substrate-binding protein [Lachnospiraceae bacterium]|nr:ABC transporter substrate-binding protein [Lachnospiraceae bacterium]